MKVLLIAGPVQTPLDEARSLTNRSSGKTALLLAEVLERAGLSLSLWLSEGATYPVPPSISVASRFSTLPELLTLISETDLTTFAWILLPAALPDYEIHQAVGPKGEPLPKTKWPGSLPKIQIELHPAFRLLPSLRAKAPHSRIIGWKWESGVSQEEAIRSARQQCLDCQSTASVLNGPAYGSGYLLIPAKGNVVPCSDAPALGQALLHLMKG